MILTFNTKYICKAYSEIWRRISGLILKTSKESTFYGGIFLPPTWDNDVNMPDNYVNMHDNYVEMQDNNADMQVTNLFREFDFYTGKMTH